MRKIFLLFVLMISFANAQAQTKYYRVKIFTDDGGLKKLVLAGVGFDHGEYKRGEYFVSDFSEHELGLIKKNNFKYQVLINDVAAYYVQRSNTETSAINDVDINCTYATPANFKYGSMGGYYTYKQMLQALDSMAKKFPNLISVKKENINNA